MVVNWNTACALLCSVSAASTTTEPPSQVPIPFKARQNGQVRRRVSFPPRHRAPSRHTNSNLRYDADYLPSTWTSNICARLYLQQYFFPFRFREHLLAFPFNRFQKTKQKKVHISLPTSFPPFRLSQLPFETFLKFQTRCSDIKEWGPV